MKSDLSASTQTNCWPHAFRTLGISFPSSDRANCDSAEKFAAEPVTGSVGGGNSLASTTWTLRGMGSRGRQHSPSSVSRSQRLRSFFVAKAVSCLAGAAA